jgi:hypothetical protein
MADNPETVPETAKIEFHYIKAENYREVPCHGAIGGITPQKQIWVSFYAERYPIPRIVQYEVPKPPEDQPTVTLNEREATPTYIDTRRGVIRHVEFTAYLDLDAAHRLRDWQDKRIAEAAAELLK